MPNHRRQRTERAEDAEAVLRSRREEFELAHLVEVNGLLRAHAEALYEYMGVMAEQRRNARREGVTITRSPFGAWEQLEAAEAVLGSQVGFVLDDRIRSLVDEARRLVAGTADAVATGEDDPDIDSMSDRLDEVYAAISVRVREIYAGRTVLPHGGPLRLPA